MHAVSTSLTEISVENIKTIMGRIREVIPVGFEHNKVACDELLMPNFGNTPSGDVDWEYPVVWREYEKARKQLGTLGGGNHFIEIQKGSDGHIWFMIHSGSRNLGKQVADHYNDLAKEINQRWFSSIPKEWDLAFLPIETDEAKSYWREMNYCLNFAKANRTVMANKVMDIFREITGAEIEGNLDVHHNYAQWENHFRNNVIIHRKGATLAREGGMGIIPGSQGTASYIVKGKGNKDSFESCSHGAGRRMGRGQATRTLNLEEEVRKMNEKGIIHGIRNTSDLDEAAGAYKDIDVVMAEQKDLVDIEVKLEPMGVIKG
jgi:tRNA-splicing ligase RtcB